MYTGNSVFGCTRLLTSQGNFQPGHHPARREQTRLDRRLLITLADLAGFEHIPWTGTPRTRTRVRRQEAVRAGPGPGPAHTKCMGVMGVGIFWRIWSENGPVYLFWGDFRL